MRYIVLIMIFISCSCISKKEIDPKASIPKCNYRDGDNSSDKVFNEKFPGKKRVVDFLINGVSYMDSLRMAHADSIWEFKYPTEYFNNFCVLNVFGQFKDSIFVVQGSYLGNYIGNNYCRDQTNIVFNDNQLYDISLNGVVYNKPINKFLLTLKKMFWSITKLSNNQLELEAQLGNKTYKLKFVSL